MRYNNNIQQNNAILRDILNAINNLPEPGSGGEYNVYSQANGDGTQTIVITDAEGGSVAPPSGDEEAEAGVTTFDSENDSVKAFIAAARAQYPSNPNLTIVADYVDINLKQDKPKQYALSGLPGSTIYLFDQRNSRGFVDTVTSGAYNINNLIPGNTTRFLCLSRNADPVIGKVKDTAKLRMLYLNKTNNFRDLGGWPCDGGKMKYGLLIRGARAYSDSGIKLDTRDIDILANWCRIHTEIDMRDADELVGIPAESPIGSTVCYLNLAMGGAYTNHFGIGSSHISQAKTIIETIMQNTVKGLPTYFHCAGGADRTGTVASILEGVCGCSSVDIDIDFELTSMTPWESHLRPRYGTDGYGRYWAEWRAHIASLGGDNPWVTWCLRAGISINLINAFRFAAIDGTPEVLDDGGIGSDIPDVEPGTNMIPISIDATGLPYNGGLGYKTGTYLGNSGGEGSDADIVVTGFMPMQIGQTLYLDNMGSYVSSTAYANNSHCKIVVYDAAFNALASHSMSSWARNYGNTYDTESGKKLLYVKISYADTDEDITNMAYVRVCAQGITDESSIRIEGVREIPTTPDIPDVPDNPVEGNALLAAIDTDGSPYNGGQGYKEGFRLNSSGGESTSSSKVVTGYIPFHMGQTISLENFRLIYDSSLSDAINYRITVYDAAFNSKYTQPVCDLVEFADNAYTTDGTYLTAITLNAMSTSGSGYSSVAYVRISGSISGVPAIYISDVALEPSEPDEPDVPENPIEGSALLAAVNTDGSLYNGGLGYKMSARLGSDGLEDTAPDNIGVTGFIPIRIGDTIRVEGMDIAANSTFEGYSSSYYRVAVYDSGFNNIYTGSQYSAIGRSDNSPVIDGDYIKQFTLNKLSGSTAITGTAYIRLSFKLSGAPAVYINS